VTAIDPDHLDIYGTYKEIVKSFTDFVNQIKPGGKLVIKKGINLQLANPGSLKVLTYSLHGKADYYAENIRLIAEKYVFDLKTPNGVFKDMTLIYPGLVNVENAVAASALSLEAGVPENEIRRGLAVYSGVKRRFDIRFRNEKILFIDDYAHHPKELEAIITSVRKMYSGKKLTGIFQPHLYSRTNDLADGFAQSLDLLDEIYLLPIYPAREKPLEGVTSDLILRKMKKPAILVGKAEVAEKVLNENPEILITLGAGDIDKIADEIAGVLERRPYV
jgi:UDP-N-acetylmuramate--alanine ligase